VPLGILAVVKLNSTDRVHVSFDSACPLSRLLDHSAVVSHATAAADRLRQRGSRSLDKPRALCRC
jgi:hypothetical protein